MIANPKLGEQVTNTCHRCNRVVRSKIALRNVQQPRTRLVVPNVMVDVCPHCGHMISISPASVEQLREAGSWK